MLIANRYEPTGAAAWGGMSEVHECLDRNLQRKVMLKRVKRTADETRLLDERKALLALRSKHVVELLDIVEISPFGVIETGLILEAISGTDLKEGSYAYGPEYLAVVWQIAQGLSDIHSARVIHRDIKPDNIRLDDNGVVKILDFGLSRQTDIDNSTRSIAGTDGYMAPELRSRTSPSITFTSAIDVFAFGETMLALLVPQQSQPKCAADLRVRQILSAADTSLQDLVIAALSDNPANRPQISEFSQKLSARLNKDKHRAWLNLNGKITEINDKQRKASITSAAAQLEISYDGFRFLVTALTGTVQFNNMPLAVGQEIPSSCVLMFGQPGQARAFVTFDVSRPEFTV